MLDQESLLAELGLGSRKLLVELTVQLNSQKSDIIYLYEGDDIDWVAQQFCQKHNLKVHNIIVENLKANLTEKENYFSFVNQPQRDNNLHQRLYQDAANKRIRQEKLYKPPPDALNKSVPNIKRTDLYEKQVKQLKFKEKSLEQQRIQKEQSQFENLTFRPQLSQNTLKIVSQTRQNRNKTPEYYLLKQGQQMKEQKRLAEQIHLNQTARDCTFKPEINNPTTKSKNNRFEQLYCQQKKQYFQQEPQYSHKPQINKKSHTKSYAPFLERMEIQQKIKEDRRRIEAEEQFIDQKSGQKLFQPSILTTNRSRGGLSIGEYLFKQQKNPDESVVMFDCEDLNKSMQTERSQKIVSEMRKRKLEEYFRTMDSDKDGFISSNAIDLDHLPTDALILLEPVILELETLDIYMNLESWVSKSLELVDKLSIIDKNRLFQKPKIIQNPPPIQAKPTINPKSEQLVKQRKKLSLYEKGMQETQMKEHRIKQKQQHKTQMELKQCTFQPRIN